MPITDRYFADHRSNDFAGRYYKSRGPLNAPPGLQRRPVICQAGGSPAGIAFAAKHADTIVARARGIEGARAYRGEVLARMKKLGRDPRSCKILFCVGLVLGETIDEAREKKKRLDRSIAENIEPRLAQVSFLSGIDFSTFDLDAPLPEIHTNASRSLTMLLTHGTGARTLREALSDPSSGGVDFVGTPDSIATEMGEAMAAIGGDGFMVTEGPTRRTIGEITDGWSPPWVEAVSSADVTITCCWRQSALLTTRSSIRWPHLAGGQHRPVLAAKAEWLLRDQREDSPGRTAMGDVRHPVVARPYQPPIRPTPAFGEVE